MADVMVETLAELPCWHADDHLLVLDKPAGLLSVPGRGPDKQDCASARAQARWPDARIVHRLDMATSGLLLMARSPAMQRILSIAFAQRTVHKRYVAVVQGHLADDAGEIDLPLLTDWPNRPRQQVHPEGKLSLTRWQVLARDSDAQGRPITRLSLEPITGRTHQLRVHLQSLGHPILGDALYGCAEAAPRMLLHASELALNHPVSAAPLQWHSTPPF
jgi:tRNA pseudouridine32 synthase/23S rRNA pseudouridine746 synthase